MRHLTVRFGSLNPFISFQIVLAFGNYMNSSKRGAACGFRLQSLDLVSSVFFKFYFVCFSIYGSLITFFTIFTFQLLETKSTDRSQTLLQFITNIIQEKYPELVNFHTELHFVDKAGLGTCTHSGGPINLLFNLIKSLNSLLFLCQSLLTAFFKISAL